MLYGILLIFLGILAVPSLLLSKKPNAIFLLEKITPYQGWIGILFLVFGIFGIIHALSIIRVISIFPLYWATLLLTVFVEATLGFILGYSLLQRYAFSKDAKAAEKGEALLAKLKPLQRKLGILAITLGIIHVIITLCYHVAFF